MMEVHNSTGFSISFLFFFFVSFTFLKTKVNISIEKEVSTTRGLIFYKNIVSVSLLAAYIRLWSEQAAVENKHCEFSL